MEFLLAPLAAAATWLFSSLRVLNQYERGVTFFLGRYAGTKGPGLIFVPFGLARMKRVSLRVVAVDIPVQDVITRDLAGERTYRGFGGDVGLTYRLQYE